MAELPQPFVPNDVPEDERSFEPIPAGTYVLQVIESKIEDTKSGTGQMLTLTLEIVDGEYANRRIWDRLNIRNQNPDAQRIAQQSLRSLCMALGITELTDSEELHFKPFEAKITIQQDKSGQYGPQNRVRYVAGDGNSAPPPQKALARPAAPARPQIKPQAAPAKGGTAKPWSKPKPAEIEEEEVPF